MRSALGRIVAWVTCASAFTATAGCGVILDLGSLEKVDCVDCDDTGDGGEGGSVAGDGAVVTPDGGAPRSDSGAEAGAVPTLATVTPAAAFATDPAATLVVTGSGFEGSSVLLFDGTPVTTTFVDASTLRADVPASALTVPKKVALTVRGSGGTSSPLAFFVSDVVLNSVTPSTLATGSGTSTITLDGKGFASDTTFWFDDSKLASNLGNDRTASAILGSAMLATAGTHRISARGRAFDAGADFASSVTLKVETPTPVIQSIDPPSALVGDSTTLTIAGTGFIPASTVTIRGTAVPTTFVNASTLMATASGTVTAVPAVLDVTVVSPAPGGGTSAPKSLTIANPTPTISSISPAIVTVGSPDTTITILGSNFVPTSVVTSGGVNANATFVSASVMTFVLPAAKLATPASYSTTVTTPSPGGGTVFGATVDVRCDDSGVTTQINAVANPVTVNLATRYGGSAEQMISAQTGSGFCPTTIQSTTGRVAAIVVQNGTAATRQLSAWNVCSFSNESAVLAFYNRATVPVFAADRAQCTFRVGLGFANSTISPERGASSQCPGLSAGNALTMPMCGRAVVFVQSPTGSAAPASLKVQLD